MPLLDAIRNLTQATRRSPLGMWTAGHETKHDTHVEKVYRHNSDVKSKVHSVHI